MPNESPDRNSPWQALALAAALTPLSASIHAQAPEAFRTEPLVITATRSAEPLSSVLRDVTIVSAEQIAASGVANLAQLLARVAGVQVAQNGPFATPSLFLRGHNSNQTLVLIDGQRIASAFSGQAALQTLGLEQIEAIEIVRGPHATFYGADAVGGVVNIITRRSGETARAGVELGLDTGSNQMLAARANARLQAGATRIDASAGHETSRGWNAIVEPRDFSFNPDRDGWRVTRGQLGLEQRLDQAWSLHARVTASTSNSQYDGSPMRDDRALVDLVAAQAGLRWQGASASSELLLAHGRESAEFVSAFGGRYVTRNQQAAWQTRAVLQPGLSALALVEWRGERIADTDGLLAKSRRTASAVLGLDWQGPIRVAGHLRLDDSNQFGTRTTGTVSAGWAAAPGVRVSLTAGTAFKAPTFNDLYYPGFSNPRLKPEASRSLEALLSWQRETMRLSLLGYRSQVRDLIRFVCDANFNCAPQNVARARLQGVTATLEQDLGALRLSASLDLLDARNRLTDRRLPRRAREWGQLSLVAPLPGGIELTATLRGSGERFDDADNRNRLPGYAVVDLAARWRFARDWQLTAALDNLFDRDYQTARGYSTGGRLWRLSLTGRF
ncbi:MAG: TonB-dependent receptor [Casimicrobiaceae bacterium]|nr:TonB-dependent receptor [Casimicrobiaceae bacterium]